MSNSLLCLSSSVASWWLRDRTAGPSLASIHLIGFCLLIVARLVWALPHISPNGPRDIITFVVGPIHLSSAWRLRFPPSSPLFFFSFSTPPFLIFLTPRPLTTVKPVTGFFFFLCPVLWLQSWTKSYFKAVRSADVLANRLCFDAVAVRDSDTRAVNMKFNGYILPSSNGRI